MYELFALLVCSLSPSKCSERESFGFIISYCVGDGSDYLSTSWLDHTGFTIARFLQSVLQVT